MPEPKTLTDRIREGMPTLLLGLFGGLISTALTLTVAWTRMGSRVDSLESWRVELQKDAPAQLKWQVDSLTTQVAAIQSDNRQRQADVAKIDTRLGIIESKIDGITDTLRRKQP